MTYEDYKKELQKAVNALGPHTVAEIVQAEADRVAATAAEIRLPDGFTWFNRDTWMGYAGATRWNDGLEPIYGSLKVYVDDAKIAEINDDQDLAVWVKGTTDVEVVIAADEGEDGEATDRAHIELTFSNSRTLRYVAKNRSAAITLLQLFVDLQKTHLPVSTLLAMGFEIIN
jgi:hypothetical protein